MASVSTYINFPRNTEEVFNYYKSIFKTEFQGEILRMNQAPGCEELNLSTEDENLIMHIELPITGGHILMGTDAPESMGFNLTMGNNIHINLQPDSKEETNYLFNKLSEGGQVTMELQDMFWGGYFGSCKDKYGVNWMFNFSDEEK
ncbi:VOC family protein [Marinigracilibium pacificum]|uniref:VOC family protein n=1 Tax=Marinigracilibium pacificum TaxID=2729599 RepID=A0A848J2E0_9BACT|nr:VOC family protein [Marinigracilibium pacificum]NMM47352.1 VOC family protein [Marinigracilibium pacificum]